MERTFKVTPAAEADLVSIATFIAVDNPAAALRQLEVLAARSALLAAFPRLGRSDPDRAGRRIFVVRPYLIIYRQVSDGIEILRYLHGRRAR